MQGRKASYRFLTTPAAAEADYDGDELDESDVWGYSCDPRAAADLRKPVPASRSTRKKTEKGDRTAAGSGGCAASSLPMNIPDWSKILKNKRPDVAAVMNVLDDGDDDEDENKGEPVIPPHELLWRNRGTSFSVHEGIGRTLKGRDLSRVRDAIWQRIGFED
ncbi:hypothetical protein HPP92_008763 [Vanilla planifolia]|uniref:Senescence regulator n=1 Tax=Vanilla planifolia TaxID=51239 RepID=A0A835R5B3_VANPL|nr:hypothetical protein HPP92_008763 [Vanilla planifolia]